MVIENTTHAQEHAFATGTVVKNRGRLWRVDGQEEDVLIATAIDTGEPEQYKFYIPFEESRPCRRKPLRCAGDRDRPVQGQGAAGGRSDEVDGARQA